MLQVYQSNTDITLLAQIRNSKYVPTTSLWIYHTNTSVTLFAQILLQILSVNSVNFDTKYQILVYKTNTGTTILLFAFLEFREFQYQIVIFIVIYQL